MRTDVAASSSPLEFETSGGGSWPEWHRYLRLGGRRAYEIGNVCDTCIFYFERIDDAEAVDVAPIASDLEIGIRSLDPGLTKHLEQMLPSGSYQTLLLNSLVRAVEPGGPGDYFTEEQVRDWSSEDDVARLPEPPHSPGVPYYRLGERKVGNGGVLFEFGIPMLPRERLAPERLHHYRALLVNGAAPTAVALSILDVKQYYDSDRPHYCLAHYILDGHHKMEAAADTGRPISMVSFLALVKGIASSKEIGEVLAELASAQGR